MGVSRPAPRLSRSSPLCAWPICDKVRLAKQWRSEQGFFAPFPEFFPPRASLGPPGGVSGPPERVLGPPERVLGPPERVLGPLERVLGPPEGVLGPPEGVLGPPEGVLGPPERGLGPPERVLGPLKRVSGPPERVLGVTKRPLGVTKGDSAVASAAMSCRPAPHRRADIREGTVPGFFRARRVRYTHLFDEVSCQDVEFPAISGPASQTDIPAGGHENKYCWAKK
jgi:hypothetical protein